MFSKTVRKETRHVFPTGTERRVVLAFVQDIPRLIGLHPFLQSVVAVDADDARLPDVPRSPDFFEAVARSCPVVEPAKHGAITDRGATATELKSNQTSSQQASKQQPETRRPAKDQWTWYEVVEKVPWVGAIKFFTAVQFTSDGIQSHSFPSGLAMASRQRIVEQGNRLQAWETTQFTGQRWVLWFATWGFDKSRDELHQALVHAVSGTSGTSGTS